MFVILLHGLNFLVTIGLQYFAHFLWNFLVGFWFMFSVHLHFAVSLLTSRFIDILRMMLQGSKVTLPKIKVCVNASEC